MVHFLLCHATLPDNMRGREVHVLKCDQARRAGGQGWLTRPRSLLLDSEEVTAHNKWSSAVLSLNWCEFYKNYRRGVGGGHREARILSWYVVSRWRGSFGKRKGKQPHSTLTLARTTTTRQHRNHHDVHLHHHDRREHHEQQQQHPNG